MKLFENTKFFAYSTKIYTFLLLINCM